MMGVGGREVCSLGMMGVGGREVCSLPLPWYDGGGGERGMLPPSPMV